MKTVYYYCTIKHISTVCASVFLSVRLHNSFHLRYTMTLFSSQTLKESPYLKGLTFPHYIIKSLSFLCFSENAHTMPNKLSQNNEESLFVKLKASGSGCAGPGIIRASLARFIHVGNTFFPISRTKTKQVLRQYHLFGKHHQHLPHISTTSG